MAITSSKTARQLLGALGEATVIEKCRCPRCKRVKTLKRLPVNFKAADVICDFCSFTAQVKAVDITRRGELPKVLLGASWPVQRDRVESGIYLPLFIVTVRNAKHPEKVLYIPSDLQVPSMFKARNPLSPTAKRAGWQGFVYDLSVLPAGIPVILWEAEETTERLL